MIRIQIPDNYVLERKYIISVLMEDFLGLGINISVDDILDYHILLPNGGKLIFKDHFFNHIIEESYLNEKYLPQSPVFHKSEFTIKSDLPILYGGIGFEKSNETIEVDADIFASSFFLLTRWEMIVSQKRDKHLRFPDAESYLRKNNLHQRALVNEYTECLWNLLTSLDDKLIRKQRKYELVITHDIDYVERYASFKYYLRALAGDIVKRKNPLLWFKTSWEYFLVRLKLRKDIYNTFDYLMDVSEKYKLKSHFYFIPGFLGEKDVRYNINSLLLSQTINDILKRGHVVGVHGTYSGFNNLQQFKKELERLSKIVPKVKEGRQHYLRFENPTTWQIWEDLGLQIDSTMGYSNDAGFVTGCCYEYHPFNVITRLKLNLLERPMVFMETGFMNRKVDDDSVIESVNVIYKEIKKYNGSFVFLWHNSNIYKSGWGNYQKLYETIVRIIHE
jgi:peptidoglycan/xylan/chitin deacetylase (PgdA/CDA1 family)